MSLITRVRDVEENGLTPKEAVILWIKEAHQFGSMTSYQCWLIEQPLSAYPLMHLPAQAVATVRARKKGLPEAHLNAALYQAQKDVIFLFYLYEHLNRRALQEEEARQLRLALLRQRLLTLVYWTYSTDRDRVDEVEVSQDPSQPPPNGRTAETRALEVEITTWPRDEALLRGEASALPGAERLLSERYFSGQPLLFPSTTEDLRAILSSLEGLYEMYESILEGRPPESDEDFLGWLLGEGCRRLPASSPRRSESDRLQLDPGRAARALAEHIVLLARAEALADMGERGPAAGLVRGWLQAQRAE